MIVKDIVYGSCGIIKAVIESDSGNEYTSSIDIDTQDTWCTCPIFVFKKEVCKHILYLLDNLELDNMPKKEYKNFLTGCMTLDSMMGNGFATGTTTAIFAESGRGKTLMSAQLSLACMKNLNQDIIYLETEGNREQDYLELLGRFKDRWEVTDADIKKHLHFYSVISSFDSKTKAMIGLLNMFGVEVEIQASTKGDKFTLTFSDCKPKLKQSDLESSGLLIIDSLTEPIKSTVGHKAQNLPARSELISRLFSKLISIATEYGICVVVIHHASINPMQMFGRDFGRPYGGDEVLYASKYIICIVDSDMSARAKYGKTARRLFLLKHPFNPTTGELFPVNLKADYGFCDED